MRRIAIGAVAVAVFAAGLWAGIGAAGSESEQAAAIGLVAKLDGRQEVPKPTGVRAAAGGTFVATLVRTGSSGRLAWRLTFHGLTGRAIAAHVHLGKSGKAGSVAISLCGPCRSGVRGTARASASVVTALLTGGAYVNVHTARNAGGEIRGQVRRGAVVLAPPASTGTTTTTTNTYTYTTPPTDPY